MKNKTLAVYLALLVGALGGHRLYLKGARDGWAWLHIALTLAGLIGISRVMAYGQDDQWSWILLPLLGISVVAACLSAIVYGLSSQIKWNQSYNSTTLKDDRSGASTGLTIFGVMVALLVGATALMSVIAFAGQRYFEFALKSA